MPRGRRNAGGGNKEETKRIRRERRGTGKKRCIGGRKGKKIGMGDDRRDEGKKGEEAGGKRAAGLAAGRALFPEVAERTQETRHALSRILLPRRPRRSGDDNGRSITNLAVTIGRERSKTREETRKDRQDRGSARVANTTRFGRWSAHVATFTCSVDRALSASIYVTLYTGPFRPLSVRRNTGFYQLLRRAPITGKL